MGEPVLSGGGEYFSSRIEENEVNEESVGNAGNVGESAVFLLTLARSQHFLIYGFR